jgi:hypothetical protein
MTTRADHERLRYTARKHGLVACKLRGSYKPASPLYGMWRLTTDDGSHLLTANYDEVLAFVERRALASTLAGAR